MKNSQTLFSLLIIMALPLFAVSQIDFNNLTSEDIEVLKHSEIDNMSYWESLADHEIIPKKANIPVKPAKFKTSRVSSKSIEQMSTDICVYEETGVTQTENSIFIDPNDDQYTLNSNNSVEVSLYGANYLHSDDGGQTWSGSKYGAGGTNRGDPATCIGTNGREYVGFIATNWGQGVAYSDNGTTWTAVNVYGPPPSGYADKNHLMINNVGGSYNGYIYDAWYHLANNASEKETVISRSTNNGVSWSTQTPISAAVAAGHHNQGVNIQIGPAGQVYAVWAIYDTWGPTVEEYREDALGFARSLNGGASYYSAIKPISNIMGIRHSSGGWASNVTGKSMRVNSFPSMAVDVSGGPYNGYIYVVWANIGTPGINTGTNVSIYMIRSTNGGVSWSSPVIVNQGSFVNDKAAFFPWITCDPVTGKLFCIFYDDRNFSTTSGDVETWVAYSEDAGTTWEDFVVSDVSFTPSPSGSSGYMGDYLGIAAQNNWVYPIWTDNRSGTALTYVSPLHFTDQCVATGGCDEYISNVSFGSINNSSICEGYSNYTAMSTDVPLNGSETLTVTIGNPYSSDDDVTIWVDWNRDDDFTDAGEEIGYASGTGPHSFSVAPPGGTTQGNCTMRIRLKYSGSPPGDPCGTTTYGEVEDYSLNVVATPGLWTGLVSTNWNVAGNWDDLTIPTSTVSVTIPSGTPYQPTIGTGTTTENAFCDNLTIQSGAVLTQTGTTTYRSFFHVNGNFNSDAGTFTQNSDYAFLYLEGSDLNSSWDDDNENDTYTMVRIVKTGTNTLNMWQNMTVKNFEIREGNFRIDATWTLTVTSSLSNAFEVESGGILTLQDETIDVTTGDIEFEDGSQANVSGGLIRCGDEFRVLANAAYDIQFTGGTVEMYGSSAQYIEDQDGNTELYDLIINKSSGTCSINYGALDVKNDLTINSGTLNCNTYDIFIGGNWTNNVGPAGFTEGTGRVVFNGPGPGMQWIYSDETFNILENNTVQAIRIGNTVTCDSYDWTSGSISVSLGTFIANDLADNGIYGNYYALTNSEIYLYQDAGQFVDLFSTNIMVVGNGLIKVIGGADESYWCTSAPLNLEIASGGVLDFDGPGITIYNTYLLYEDITDGSIKTSGWLTCYRTDFNPAGGTFEFYGGTDANINVAAGSTFFDVSINKSGGDKSVIQYEDRDGKLVESTKSNIAFLYSDVDIINELTIADGELTLNGYELTVGHDCHVYGTINMTNAADILSVGTNNYDNFEFYDGSTGNLSNGEVYLASWVRAMGNSSLVATTGNTIYFTGTNSSSGLRVDNTNSSFGNIDVNKSSGYLYTYSSSYDPFIVNGNFTMHAGNTMDMQDYTTVIHGVLTDNATSTIYVYNGPVDNKSAEIATGSEKVESTKGSGSKGAYLEIDNDFTLNGLLDVADGDVLLHGDINIASTGTLDITTGSVIADQPYQFTDAWQYISGSVNLTDGLFEISYNSFRFTSASVNNISGGIIRNGVGFHTDGSVFNPSGGLVELTGQMPNANINLGPGSTFYNLTVNSSAGDTIHYNSDITVTNDIEIQAGNIESGYGGSYNLYIGGNWTDNSGGFIPNTGTVFFNGTGDVSITPGETFYNLTLDKASSADWLTHNGDLTIANNLEINPGALYSGANTISVSGDATINTGGVLYMQANSTLELDDGSNLLVNNGGWLYVIGTAGNEATVTHVSTGFYDFDIYSGGTIAAEYGIFEYMTNNGVYVQIGATINPVYAFNYCTFQNGTPGYAILLIINNDQILSSTGANFPASGGTLYNVWKYAGSTGEITFVDATGFFAGPAYEYDPSEGIHWTGFVPGLWTGAVSSDWFTPENWDDYIIPDASTNVTIPASTPNDPVINGAAAYCGDISVDAGASLEVGNNHLYVGDEAFIYGELVMTNPSGVMHIDHRIYWQPGSTDNVTAGEIRSTYWTWEDGTNAQLGTGNTAYVKTGISPYDADASFGNLVITTTLSESGGVDDKGTYPLLVSGNCLMESGINWQTPIDIYINGTWEIENGATFEIHSGAIVSCDMDFTLDGVLNLSNPTGGALVHGNFNFGSTGVLNVNDALFICDYTLPAGWISLYGDITMTTGLLEFTDGNVIFAGTSTISDGIIRAGRTINASVAGALQPSGGTLELTGSGGGHYIQIINGNYVYNLNANRTDIIVVSMSSPLTIQNDLTVNSVLNSNNNIITVNGNIDINSGGSLNMNANGILEIGTSQVLSVNSGGTLSVVGSSGNEATITHSSGYYNLNVFNGGTISAEYGIFEYMASAGINLMGNAIVDAGHPFDNCLFRNGTAGGRLLTVNSIQTFTVNNAIFPTNTWGGAYNVYKSVDAGVVNFNNATGGFDGEDYDYDPYNRVNWTVPSFNLDLTVFLEGPFNTGTLQMNTNLNGIIPNNHPFYPTLPYFGNPMPDWFYTGSENALTPNIYVVDWILVELRDASSAAAAMPGTMIAQQAAFLLNTGEVVDLDGVSLLSFTATVNDDLYVVVWHRNHLGILSASSPSFGGGTYTYDFSSGSGQAYGGSSAHKLLGGGLWGMMSGDGDGSGQVLTADKNAPWAIQAGIAGYLEGDYNMNGQVNNLDKNDNWVPNLGSGSYIPE